MKFDTFEALKKDMESVGIEIENVDWNNSTAEDKEHLADHPELKDATLFMNSPEDAMGWYFTDEAAMLKFFNDGNKVDQRFAFGLEA